DEYLTLYIKQVSYDKQILIQMEELFSRFEQELAARSGWLILNVDFRSQDQNNTFDWKEYYRIAQLLQNRSGENLPQEAAERTAASRAYYGALCRIRNTARDGGFAPSAKADDHRL